MFNSMFAATVMFLNTEPGSWLVPLASLALLGVLIFKELLSGIDYNQVRRVNGTLNVVIIPLVVVFISSVVIKVADALGSLGFLK